MYGNTEISMISLFGLGDISPQQRDIATATSHVVRDIATALCGITWYDFCSNHMLRFLKSYHTKSLRFPRHHTQLPFEMAVTARPAKRDDTRDVYIA